jgi:pyruvate dehydrogenase phosphatase
MINHNPVLAMMGSCVLVMLMKGEDVYLMNVGDSRAVLATRIGNHPQLTMDHSTHVKEVGFLDLLKLSNYLI